MSATSSLQVRLTVARDEMRESLLLQRDILTDMPEDRVHFSIAHTLDALEHIDAVLHARAHRPERSLFSASDVTLLQHMLHFTDAITDRLMEIGSYSSSQHEIWRSIAASVAAMRAMTSSLLEEEL